MSTSDLINTFIKHRNYLKKANINLKYVQGDNSPYIYIENPIIISAFVGFIKKTYSTKDICFRGEAGNYEHIIPSLFRDVNGPLLDNMEILNRYNAYSEFKKETIGHYKNIVSRFKNEDVDNLFQHYGIKSPVVDMVDNIYTAIWFAMDGNNTKYGFIRLLNTTYDDLVVSDLRKTHSSLSLRLHTQHGLIGKKIVKSWNKDNIAYDKYEIARIKFPVNYDIANGILFSRENIYPNTALDNTFKILKNSSWVESKIAEIEKKYNLIQGVLGFVK